jgi:ABC-2 type transport system permease protein
MTVATGVRAAAARVLAISRKEFIHIGRDWRMIVAVLVLPLLQLLLFAYAISFDVRNVPTVTLDLDRSVASREYLDAYTRSGFFDVQGSVVDLAGIDSAFNRGQARVAIVVARGYGAEIAAGRTGSVSVLIDGSEPNSALLGRTYAIALNQVLGRQGLAAWADTQGLSPPRVGRLEPRLRAWYNPERRSADFLIPGLMIVIIMIVTIQQTAVTLVKERENGTLEQLLESPLSHSELIVGKILPWAFLGVVDTVTITGVAMGVFGIPLRGDVAVLAVGIGLFIVCALSLGLVISAVAPSLESANIAALLLSFLPGFMLSGMAFPLESIPLPLQVVSYLFPARYMVEIARGVFLKGASWDVLMPQVLALAAYALVALGVATVLNRRRRG